MTWITTLISLIALLYFFLLLFYLMGWRRLKTILIPQGFHPTTHITVIIPARNEEKNIEACLRSILQNNYPKELLEIILIDDCSEDKTQIIAQNVLRPDRDQILYLKDFLDPESEINSYKKKALGIAVVKAHGTLIITTDADCICKPDWLRTMAYTKESANAEVLVAPVSFTPNAAKSILYYFQSLDFMTMQGITGALTALDMGSMSNGANFGFSKTAFERVGGYKGIDEIASGDDMLLLYKIKQHFPNSVAYVPSIGAIVQTPCQPNLSGFINQRIRWASKSDKYQDKLMTVMLGVVYLFNLSLPGLLAGGFFSPHYWHLLLFLFLIKIVLELAFLFPVARFYRKEKELFIFPFLEPFHILYIVSVGFLGKFGKYNWKGRRVK